MTQKRYDGTGKGRTVKRQAPKKEQVRTLCFSLLVPKKKSEAMDVSKTDKREEIFNGIVFYALDESILDEEIENQIQELGGFVAKTFSKKVTHVVTGTKDVTPKQEQQIQAQEVKAVSVDFIKDSIKKQKKLDEEDYSKSSKKRKADEDDEDEKVKWYWQSDKGWELYDEETSERLETAYQNKEEKAKVDTKRIVEFAQMVQKRVDDPKKVRPVKREAGNASKKQKVSKSGHMKVIKKGSAAVDPHSRLGATCHVLEEGKEVFSATLNLTEIGGQKGSNKFYIIQLLEHDTHSQTWYLWTRWGRGMKLVVMLISFTVGMSGQNTQEEFNNKQDAKKAFMKKYVNTCW